MVLTKLFIILSLAFMAQAQIHKVSLAMPAASGTFRYKWTFKLCGISACFTEAKSGTASYKNGVVHLLNPGRDNSFIQVQTLEVDNGRHAKGKCSWRNVGLAKMVPATAGDRWCGADEYHSRSFWRPTCKREGTIEFKFFDKAGSQLKPTSAGNLFYCGRDIPHRR